MSDMCRERNHDDEGRAARAGGTAPGSVRVRATGDHPARYRVLVPHLAQPDISDAETSRPNSMAALGDSITRAADVCCWYADHPADSWSTGNSPYDGVYSQYERLV